MNPKTIKEIVKEFSINYISEYRWRKDAINNLSAEDFIEKSLLSLLDEVEKRLPAGIDMTNSYHQQVINLISDLREGK